MALAGSKRTAEEEGGPQAKRARADDVQVTASSEEMRRRIAAFAERSEAAAGQSNAREFVDRSKEGWCSRTDPARIERRLQIRLEQVHNEAGPLEATAVGTAAEEAEEEAGPPPGVEERLALLEEYLRVGRAPPPAGKEVYRRLQALEDRLDDLEARVKASLPALLDAGLLPPLSDTAASDAATAAATAPAKAAEEEARELEVAARTPGSGAPPVTLRAALVAAPQEQAELDARIAALQAKLQRP